jgi:hypothetical protein
MGADIIGYHEDFGVMGSEIIGDDYFSGDIYTGDSSLDALLAMGAAPMQRRRGTSRPIGKQFAVAQTSRGVWREQYVPLNLTTGPTGTIAAGATVIVSTVLQKKFRPNRLILDSGVAGGYVVNDVRVGVLPQVGALGSLPGRMFSELAVGVGLHGDTGDPGISLSVSVTNITGGALTFVAGFQGIVVE